MFVHTARASLCIALVCVIVTPSQAQLRAELVAGGFTQPVALVQHPSDAAVQLVVQQDGLIRVLRSGVVQASDFLDLRGVVRNSGEQGLLGLALAPDYATSGRAFVNFTNTAGDTVIARFNRLSADPLQADPESRFDLRWPDGQRIIDQPFANHNGGNLVFGPDGYLYVGMGDGGSGNDPGHRAQNPQTLLGKMLRLDVAVPDSDPEGYNVPPTNPLVGRADVLGEIWSFGLRNPWRYSFDNPLLGGTGALVLGDVGQNAWEEIDYEPAGRGGRNYGWRNREGAHNNVTSLPPFSTPLIDPIFEYPSSVGQAITGGYVYRGSVLGASFRGRYFFADFASSRVWSIGLTVNASTGEAFASGLVEHTSELGTAGQNPSSFGVDAAGELYIVNYTGTIHRLAADAPGNPGSGSGSGGARTPSSDAVIVGRAKPGPGHSAFGSLAATPPAVPQTLRLRIEVLDAVFGVMTCEGSMPIDEPFEFAEWLRLVLAACGTDQPLHVQISVED